MGEALVEGGVVFAEIAAGKRGTALPRIVDARQGKARVLRASPQAGLPAAGVPDHRDLRRVDVGIGLEVVQRPRARPGPGTESAPGELVRFRIMLTIESSYT